MKSDLIPEIKKKNPQSLFYVVVPTIPSVSCIYQNQTLGEKRSGAQKLDSHLFGFLPPINTGEKRSGATKLDSRRGFLPPLLN